MRWVWWWYLAAPSISIGVTKSSVENLDSNLTSLRWSHLNILDDQWFVGFPGHRSFTNITTYTKMVSSSVFQMTE
jgi:hypothetical protein